MNQAGVVSEINGNQPAFPVSSGVNSTGLTLRDWMASAALQGLAAKGLEVKADRAMTEKEKDQAMARMAYRLADAMLAVRAEPESAE
ncbi:MAG: hypothetical protein R3C28_23975 [Pirellulaceae bacterium]